jgi:hypothetical protein
MELAKLLDNPPHDIEVERNYKCGKKYLTVKTFGKEKIDHCYKLIQEYQTKNNDVNIYCKMSTIKIIKSGYENKYKVWEEKQRYYREKLNKQLEEWKREGYKIDIRQVIYPDSLIPIEFYYQEDCRTWEIEYDNNSLLGKEIFKIKSKTKLN